MNAGTTQTDSPTPTAATPTADPRGKVTLGYVVNGKQYRLPHGVGEPARLYLAGLTNDEREGYLLSKGYKVVERMNMDPVKRKAADLSGMSEEARRVLREMGEAQRARDKREAPMFTEEEKSEFRAIAEAARAREAEAHANADGMTVHGVT